MLLQYNYMLPRLFFKCRKPTKYSFFWQTKLLSCSWLFLLLCIITVPIEKLRFSSLSRDWAWGSFNLFLEFWQVWSSNFVCSCENRSVYSLVVLYANARSTLIPDDRTTVGKLKLTILPLRNHCQCRYRCERVSADICSLILRNYLNIDG